MNAFTSEDEANLRETLKRCSATTCIAAREFRKTGDAEHLPAIVRGVIERCVRHDAQMKLREADDEVRLAEDLGVDSLTMLEIVLLLEEVLRISINNEELRPLRTMGDVKHFIELKMDAVRRSNPAKYLILT
jgi:3-hydroxyacyl-[acyl-carrier-protein] dehydratase